MTMVIRNKMPARKSFAGQFTDLVAGIEDPLKSIVRLRGKISSVGFVPEAQVALGARHEAGL